MANFCMSCGVPVEPIAKFCELCGQELEQEQPEIQPGIYPEVQPIEYAVDQQQPQLVYSQQPQLVYPQHPQPQPLYLQHPHPQAVAKKKSKLPLILGIVGGTVVLIIVTVVVTVVPVLRGASGTLSNMTKANFYEIGNDEVASMKLALGEQRTVTGVSTSTKKGAAIKEITFSADDSNQYEDMTAYVNYLREDDFLLVSDVDFNEDEGEVTLGRDSVDKGYSILVELEYDDTGYVITLIRQKGEVTVHDIPDTDVLPGIDPGTDTGPTHDSEPVSDNDSGSKSDSDPGPIQVIAAKSAIEIFDSGCYHLIMTFDIEDQGSIEMETYKNGTKAALITRFNGVTTKMVIKDGKIYTIVDDFKTVYVSDTGAEEMMPEYGSASMSYIGEGSGDFNGKTYPYSEYSENDGGRSYYFMDGDTLKGIRVNLTDDSAFETTVLLLDTNVPDDVFSWPSNYEVHDS